jgi:class 3 adenylate cyclase
MLFLMPWRKWFLAAESGLPALARPSGTVTFLFSDIEGGTVRWKCDSEAMQDAVRGHDALMRRAIGQPIDCEQRYKS